MTEPDADAAPDLASISTEDELRIAVLGLLGDSYDRAVERRTGLSKTTVNDLRNHRRRLTVKTLTLIVDAYDPSRRDAWLAAWRTTRAKAANVAAPPDAASRPTTPDSAESRSIESSSTEGFDTIEDPSPSPARLRRVRRPRLRLAVGSALAAVSMAAATVAIVLVVAGGGAETTAAADPNAIPGADALPGGQTLPGGQIGPGAPGVPGFAPPPHGPGGPGGPGAPGPIGGPGPPPASSMSSRRGTPEATADGCYALPLQTAADVVEEPGARTTGVHLTAASYTYYPAWNPSLAIGGQLDQRLPTGRRLVGANWADPTTVDSTPARSPGNGRFYPGGELELNEENCFTVPPYNIGYGGYSGITTRVYLMLVDAARVSTFPHEAAQLAGFTEADLAARGIDVLGYFVVPSSTA